MDVALGNHIPPWQAVRQNQLLFPHECLHFICIDKYFCPPRLQASYLRSERQLQALGPGILWISYLVPSTVWNFLPNRMLVYTCWEKLNTQHYYLTPMFTRISSRRPADQMKRTWAAVNSASLSFLLNILCPESPSGFFSNASPREELTETIRLLLQLYSL